MFFLLAIAGLGLLGLIVQHFINLYNQKQCARQRGCLPPARRAHRLPFGIDFVQNLIKADREKAVPTYLVNLQRNVMKKNTWIQNVLGRDTLVTCEPENIKAILATQFKDFELGPRRKGSFSPLFANGIFSDDGAQWEHSRALIRPQFVREQITDIARLEIHVQNLMRALTADVDSSGWTQTQDFVPLFFRQTLDSSTEFLFGQSVNSQMSAFHDEHHTTPLHHTSGDLAWDKFGPAFDAATMELAQRIRLNGGYWLYNTKLMRDSCREVQRFADHFVKLALDAPQNDEKTPESNSRQSYVFLHEIAKSTRDPVELRDQLLNVLLAGRDTTAGLLAFVMYQLARHPEIFAKLRRAVLDDFGSYENPRTIDFTALKACTYLQHVLNEALRLHPSVPFNTRRSVRDTTLPIGGGPDQKSPVFVPKGTEITYSVQVLHRRIDLWGEDADVFRPERWIGRRHGFEFLPFNGGPRICLGQQFALTTAGYTIARLCQRFDQLADLVPHDATSDTEKYWYSLTAAPIHVKVRLHQT